jgi:hypothetical protein
MPARQRMGIDLRCLKQIKALSNDFNEFKTVQAMAERQPRPEGGVLARGGVMLSWPGEM